MTEEKHRTPIYGDGGSEVTFEVDRGGGVPFFRVVGVRMSDGTVLGCGDVEARRLEGYERATSRVPIWYRG